MKKALIYGLSVAMLLVSLTACNKPQDTQQTNQSEPPQAATSTPATEPTSTPEPPAQNTSEPLSNKTPATPDENEASQPPEETASPEPDETVDLFEDCNETVYATGTVNIRESWSASSTKLGSLNKGDAVTRTGNSIAGTEAEGWSRVSLADGSTAYISNTYLSTTKPVTQNTSKPTGGGTTQTQTQTQKPATGGGETTTIPPTSGDAFESGTWAANRQQLLEQQGYIGTDASERVDMTSDEYEDFVKGIVDAIN